MRRSDRRSRGCLQRGGRGLNPTSAVVAGLVLLLSASTARAYGGETVEGCLRTVDSLEQEIKARKKLLKKLPKPAVSETKEDRLCRAIGETSKVAIQPRDRIFFEDKCVCEALCGRRGTAFHAWLVTQRLGGLSRKLEEKHGECAVLIERERADREDRERQERADREDRERQERADREAAEARRVEQERLERDFLAWKHDNAAWMERVQAVLALFVKCMEDPARTDCKSDADLFWAVCNKGSDPDKSTKYCNDAWSSRAQRR